MSMVKTATPKRRRKSRVKTATNAPMSVTVSARTSMLIVTVVVHVRSQSKVPSAESAGRTHEQTS